MGFEFVTLTCFKFLPFGFFGGRAYLAKQKFILIFYCNFDNFYGTGFDVFSFTCAAFKSFLLNFSEGLHVFNNIWHLNF